MVNELLSISIVVPFYNEEGNVYKVYKSIKGVIDNYLKKDLSSYEIIFVDDGSLDNTYKLIEDLASEDFQLKVIKFAFNCGQTAAMQAGFNLAQNNIIIPMDGDMQNDPSDIVLLLEKIREGYDVVSGWRKNRKDKFLTRKFPSIIANKLISLISQVNLHDYGCSLKAYRKSILKKIKLYGEMHRFIPIYAHWNGAKIAEVVVKHHIRYSGFSKYGILRTFKVILDLIMIKFMGRYATRPIHFFGSLGFLSFILAFLGFIYVLYKQLKEGIFIDSPIFLFSIMGILLGAQFILMGLLAEMQVRIYHESQGKHPYVIEKQKNL